MEDKKDAVSAPIASTPELQQLKALALAATPGPWTYFYEGGGDYPVVSQTSLVTKGNADDDTDDDNEIVCCSRHWCEGSHEQMSSNAEYLAKLPPETVLALIALASRAAQPVEASCDLSATDVLRRFVAALDGKLAAINADEPGFEFNDQLWALLEPARAALDAANYTGRATDPLEPATLTMGDAFKSVGGWMAGGALGYPSFGSMDALRVYTIRMILPHIKLSNEVSTGEKE